MSWKNTVDRACRRTLDLAASTIGLVLLSPLFALVALAVKLDSAGPILFRGQRSGRAGEPFRMIKFRTMVADAAHKGPGITSAGDLRVTRVGRVLRRTKLDELPQLINVLRGDMTLVGPRPEDPAYVADYTVEQRRLLDVRPGITGPASVRFRNEEQLLRGEDWERRYRDQILPAKLRIELDYLERRSVLNDLSIVMQTVIALFR
jgi:lipopolysaccharide/colanic/teichoic acid biosynthesis glycosyltransferase